MIAEEKTVIVEKERGVRNPASQGTALGIGIPALALGAYAAYKVHSGEYGRMGCAGAAGVAAVGAAEYVERKECQDVLDLTNSMWSMRVNDITEKNNLERYLSGKINANEMADFQRGFDLYKNQRDQFDILNSRISDLSTHVAVTDAVLPWQLKSVADNAAWDLRERTCRMISGEVILPNTPIVTGLASYTKCAQPIK